MSNERQSDTIVIQTFRSHDRPAWIQRCLDSVGAWASWHGHDYVLAGDEFFDLCGPEYLRRGSKNPRAITNLARLVATRQHLDAGYDKVIWMDADMFVFDPDRLSFDFSTESLPTGYAFGREVWVDSQPDGRTVATRPRAHNAATYFTQAAVDLDMLIALIRHIDAGREIISNFQVGVSLLRGLQYSLMFPIFSHACVLSPAIITALANKNERLLRFYGEIYCYRCCAANLTLSQQDLMSERLLWAAMDRLEDGAGQAINQYATDARLCLAASARDPP